MIPWDKYDPLFNNRAPEESKIDTDAVAILSSATKAVAAILERRAELDRQGRQNEPLIVLAGENHARPANKIHHMLVLKKIQAVESALAVAYEQPHNTLSRVFFDTLNKTPDAAIAARLKNEDPGGALTLKASLSLLRYFDTDHAHFTLYNFLLHNNITTRFTDVAKTQETLNQDDPSTAESLKECLGTAASGVALSSAEGLWIRNDHMVRQDIDFVRSTGARILFQICGNDHVAGRQGKYPAQKSLAALFREKNIAIMALPSSFFHPPDHGLEQNELLVADGQPKTEATYSPFTDKCDRPQAQLQCQTQEVAWLNPRMDRAGLEEDRVTLYDREQIKKSCQKETASKFRDWNKEFYGIPPP